MITVEPIGHVRSSRTDLCDDNWGGVMAWIELVESLPPESLDGIETFSHNDGTKGNADAFGPARPAGARRVGQRRVLPRLGQLNGP